MADKTGAIGVKLKKFHIPDVDTEKAYPMDQPKMGHALIVNNVEKEMPGSVNDVEALKAAYEQLGFQVLVHKNCDVQKMAEIKRWFLKDEPHAESNCFLLTVIGHGNDKGHLLDRNKARGWVIEDLVRDLSLVDTLRGKPKLLVLQACRGRSWSVGSAVPSGALSEEDDIEVPIILPDKADVFLAYATVPGYIAHGGDEGGSHYLQAFAAYLVRYMDKDLDTIYKAVNQYMSTTRQGKEGIKQCSEKRSTLRYQLRFSEFRNKSSTKSAPKVTFPAKPSSVSSASPTTPTKPTTPKTPTASLSSASSPTTKPPAKTASASKTTKLKPQSPASLEMKLLSTYDTDLGFWKKTRFAVLPSGTVILWGKESESDLAALHVYRLNSSGLSKWMTGDNAKVLCNCNEGVYVLPVTINQQELLAISCRLCQEIGLYNPDKDRVTYHFQNFDYFPAHMCQSENGTLYVVNAVEGRPIMELDYSDYPSPFGGPKRMIQSGMDDLFFMYYVSAPHKLIVISGVTDSSLIRAVSTETGTKAWEVSGKVDGKMCHPRGMVFSPQHGALLVADGKQCRVLVLDPRDGSHLKTIQLGWVIGVVVHLDWYHDKMVLHHITADKKEKVSLFEMCK